jgi:hypothetical protein
MEVYRMRFRQQSGCLLSWATAATKIELPRVNLRGWNSSRLTRIKTHDALADFRGPSVVVVRLTCGFDARQDSLRKRVSFFWRQLCRDLSEVIDRLNHGEVIMGNDWNVQPSILRHGGAAAWRREEQE